MTEHKKQYQNIKVTTLDNSEVEIAGEISAEYVDLCKVKALKHIAKNIEIPGFRKGHVPEAMVIQQAGEMAILEEAGEMALNDEYGKILAEHKIDAIGRPEVTITKLAAGNPLGFKIKTAVMPAVTLAPYKKIAEEEMSKKEELIEVTDKDIEDVIFQVRKSRVPHVHDEKGHDHGDHNHAEGEHDHTHEEKTEAPKTKSEIKGDGKSEKDETENLPEFTDEFVKSLGDFKDIADFKQKIKDNLLLEKKASHKEKKRIALVEKIIEGSKISLPKILVEGELEKMVAQFKDDVERAGMKYEEYLSHIKKTEEELRNEWKANAEKKAKLQLILNKIAIDEKIEPDTEQVKKEVENILKHHKDADPRRAQIYVETYLTNEKVFQFLERKK